MPNDSFMNLDLKKMIEMDEEEYREVFRGSAVKRTKFSGLKRNVIAVSKTRKK
jgi:epoxyqueuosine reductase